MTEETTVVTAAETPAAPAAVSYEAPATAKVDAPAAAPADASVAATGEPKVVPLDAAKATTWSQRLGYERVQTHGVTKAAQQTFGDVKTAFSAGGTLPQKGVVALRGGSVVLGSVIALKSLRAKDAQGNDRGVLARGSQAALGIGMIGAGVLAGRA